MVKPVPTNARCRVTVNNGRWSKYIINADDNLMYFPTSTNSLNLPPMQLDDVINQDLNIEIEYFARNNPRTTFVPSNLLIQYNKVNDAVSTSRGLSFWPTIDSTSDEFSGSKVVLSAQKHFIPKLDKISKISLYYQSNQINVDEITFFVKEPKIIAKKIDTKNPSETFLYKWNQQTTENGNKLTNQWNLEPINNNNNGGEEVSKNAPGGTDDPNDTNRKDYSLLTTGN